MKQSDVRRIHDGMDVIREVDGLRQTDAQGNIVYLYKTINYTRDGNIGGLLSKTDAGTNSSLFYHYDGSGNVSQLTDANQATVATYEYDAYGRMLSFSGVQASSNPYRYQTKEQHQASGLYDYGFRFYSPSSGRWINRDPIREMGGLNLYGFVGNDPTNGGDPYGLKRRDFGIPGQQNCPPATFDGIPKNHDVNGDGRVDWDYPGDIVIGNTGIALGFFGVDVDEGDPLAAFQSPDDYFLLGVGPDKNHNGQLDPEEIKHFIGKCMWADGQNNRYVHWNSANGSGPGAHNFKYDLKTGDFFHIRPGGGRPSYKFPVTPGIGKIIGPPKK